MDDLIPPLGYRRRYPARRTEMAFLKFPTDEDVNALMHHQYPPDDHADVVELLSRVNHNGHMGWSPSKIRLAALAMSNGTKELIAQWVDQGNRDCRDLQLTVNGTLGPSWDRKCLQDIAR